MNIFFANPRHIEMNCLLGEMSSEGQLHRDPVVKKSNEAGEELPCELNIAFDERARPQA
jgi:hypothetical protein